MSGPRLMIAGNMNWQAGFSNTVADYVRAAGEAGCEIRVCTPLSRVDDLVARRLPTADDVGWGTHLIFMFDARQYLSEAQLELAERVPRHRRAIIDFDGHWGDDGDAQDRLGDYSPESWHRLYSDLADLVLQPRIGGRVPDGAEFFPCFGFPVSPRKPRSEGHDYDLQYIGSNWRRWSQWTEVVDAMLAVRTRPLRIRVCGRWWDGDHMDGYAEETASEPGALRLRGVEVAPSVPFGNVIEEMGRALVSPLLARPLASESGVLTPRVFESFASGSLPVLSSSTEYLLPFLGEGADELRLGDSPREVLADMLTAPDRYVETVSSIQKRLHDEYAYPRVLTRLLSYLP